MALNKALLQQNLETLFKSMTDGNEETFPLGIANHTVSFVSTGIVNTVDAGTVTGGAFTGKGTGTLTVEPTQCYLIIKNACTVMKNMTEGGNDYLAVEMGKAFQKMADDGIVNTSVTGTLYPPSSSPVAYGGSTKGDINCVSSPLIAELKTLFTEMWNYREQETYDGNKEFARRLANAINTFFTSGVISTQGLGNLAGSIGTGSIS